MKVIEQTTKLPPNAHPSDFDFARQVVTELELVPTKEKVYFPLPSRNSVFADIECHLGYNSDDKPYAEFKFLSRRHELQMAHSAVVLTTIADGIIQYHLQIRPCKRLRSNGHRTICTTHKTAKDMALAICRNYFPGTVGRKVIPLEEKKAA